MRVKLSLKKWVAVRTKPGTPFVRGAWISKQFQNDRFPMHCQRKTDN
ncbi:6490_t:CDS:1, partial [Paraglomus brasilianum]